MRFVWGANGRFKLRAHNKDRYRGESKSNRLHTMNHSHTATGKRYVRAAAIRLLGYDYDRIQKQKLGTKYQLKEHEPLPT